MNFHQFFRLFLKIKKFKYKVFFILQYKIPDEIKHTF